MSVGLALLLGALAAAPSPKAAEKPNVVTVNVPCPNVKPRSFIRPTNADIEAYYREFYKKYPNMTHCRPRWYLAD